MNYYIIEFASKHSHYFFEEGIATFDWISENIVAEIPVGRYGKYLPVHPEERAYYASVPTFEALVECKPQHIRMFVNGLRGNMQDDSDIHYFLLKRGDNKRAN